MSFASTTLTCIDPHGFRFETTIEVGPPRIVSDIEAVCPVRMPGEREIHGGDMLQALCLTLRHARFLLDEFVKYGGKLYMEPECDVAVPPGLVVSVGSIINTADEYPEFVEEMRRRAEADDDIPHG